MQKKMVQTKGALSFSMVLRSARGALSCSAAIHSPP